MIYNPIAKAQLDGYRVGFDEGKYTGELEGNKTGKIEGAKMVVLDLLKIADETDCEDLRWNVRQYALKNNIDIYEVSTR